jgi:hypothetical protein
MANTCSPEEQAIRDRFPGPRYRVSKYEYPAGTAFGLTIRKATCHVIEGACRYATLTDEILLKGGEKCELKSGGYRFEVLGDSRVICLHVWDIEAIKEDAK